MDDDLAKLFLQLAGIMCGVSLVLWWMIRPFSFTYRIEGSELVVRTFLILTHARIPLDSICGCTLQAPECGKTALRVLSPPYDLLGRKRCYATTDQEILALPGWHQAWLGSSSSRSSDDLASAYAHRRDFLSALKNPACVPIKGEIPASFVIGARIFARLAHWTKDHGLPASICAMIVIPLGLTACELVGAELISREFPVTWGEALQIIGIPHFAASAFVFLCGICLRVVLAKGLPQPHLLAAAAILSAIGHLSMQPEASHDLSHIMFGSCEGYDNLLATSSGSILVAALVVLIAASKPRPLPPQLSDSRAEAATP